MPLFRFTRFRTRVLALVLGLLVAALGTNYFLVSRANTANARRHAEDNLVLGARIYAETVNQRIDYLVRSARVMAGDYAIKQVLLADRVDTRTLASVLRTYTLRVAAPVIVMFDPELTLLASSQGGMSDENRGPFRYLITLAEKEAMPNAHGYSFLNGALHVLVVVPLYAPEPNIVAWFGLAFPIDRPFAQTIKDTTCLLYTSDAADE